MNATAHREATAAISQLGLQSAIEAADLTAFAESAGPVARAAMAKAKQVTGCVYPVYLNGQAVREWVAELPQADQKPVIEALRSSDFTESKLGGATRFALSQREEDQPGMPGSGASRTISYLFIGDVWAAIVSSGEQDYTQAALDGVLAANPSLDERAAQPPAPPTRECSERDGLAELASWAPTVQGGPWDTTGRFSDASGYDACATLSWIVLRPEPCCTRFSATPVLFFLHGDFYQLATETHYAIAGDIERLADNQAAVTYMWQAPGSSNADAPATAVSRFTLDPDTGLVDRDGELPPD